MIGIVFNRVCFHIQPTPICGDFANTADVQSDSLLVRLQPPKSRQRLAANSADRQPIIILAIRTGNEGTFSNPAWNRLCESIGIGSSGHYFLAADGLWVMLR